MFAESGCSEFFRAHVVNMSNRDGVDGAADEIDLVAFDILNDHDSFLSQKVKRQLIGGILEDTLLD